MSYKKSALLLCIIILLFEMTVAFIGKINTREPWGDELRFYATIIDFGNSLTVDLLQHYNQMSTPLPFMMYAWWGKLFGFELFTLRIFSIILAFLTYLLFHRILYEKLTNKRFALYGTLFFMIHPYMVGLSIFVFTDTLAILFLLLGYYAFDKEKFALGIISLALAILCRQYMLFFLPPVFIYYALRLMPTRAFITSIVPALPYFLLIIFWGGTSPDNEFRNIYLNDGFSFQLNILFLYISLLFLYLLPFYFMTIKYFYKNKMILGSALAVSFLYFLCPIQPSIYSQDIGVYTVGLFHRALKFMIQSDTVIQGIFYLAVLLGLPVLFTFIKEVGSTFQKSNNSILFFSHAVFIFRLGEIFHANPPFCNTTITFVNRRQIYTSIILIVTFPNYGLAKINKINPPTILNIAGGFLL